MNTIYVVTGCEDDFEAETWVCGVYSSEILAKAAVALKEKEMGSNYIFEIEDFEVDKFY